jgi:hypothetical protein
MRVPIVLELLLLLLLVVVLLLLQQLVAQSVAPLSQLFVLSIKLTLPLLLLLVRLALLDTPYLLLRGLESRGPGCAAVGEQVVAIGRSAASPSCAHARCWTK